MRLRPDDIELVMECDTCGPEITECALKKCEECGDSWVKEDYTLSLLGNDVVSLFLNMDSRTTGRLVKEEVSNSTINIEGFNYKMGTKYVVTVIAKE